MSIFADLLAGWRTEFHRLWMSRDQIPNPDPATISPGRTNPHPCACRILVYPNGIPKNATLMNATL